MVEVVAKEAVISDAAKEAILGLLRQPVGNERNPNKNWKVGR